MQTKEKDTHLRNEGGQTTNRIDDGSASRLVARVALPQPGCPNDDRDTEQRQGDSRDDLCEEPDFTLDGRQFEFRLSGHGDDATHDGSVTDGKNNPGTCTLDNKSRVESQVTSLECIGGGGIDSSRNHVTVKGGLRCETEGKLKLRTNLSPVRRDRSKRRSVEA
jgi:hypothetical protein